MKKEEVIDLGERYINVEQELKERERELEREKNRLADERRAVQSHKQKFEMIQQ